MTFTSNTNLSSSSSSSGLIQAAEQAISELQKRQNPLVPVQPLSPAIFSKDLRLSSLDSTQEESWRARLDASLFAHIHGDRDVWKTDLEGNTLENTSSFLIEYILAATPSLLNEKSLKLLKTLQDPQDAKQTTERILKLTPGQGLLIPGGWEGKPGHGMIYQFEKRENGNNNIYIYNTGCGTNKFHSQVQTRDKLKIHPVLCYLNVEPEELCLPGSDLIQRLLEIKKPLDSNEKEEGRAELIYEGIFGRISHRIGSLPNDPVGAITGARAGICTMHVFKPLMCHLIGDKAKYKVWRFWFKFDTLRAFYNKGNLNEQEWLLLQNGAKNMLLSAEKLYGKNLIAQSDAEMVYATCCDLIERIEKNEEILKPFPVESDWPTHLKQHSNILDSVLMGANNTLVIPDTSLIDLKTPTIPFPSQAPPSEVLSQFLKTFLLSLEIRIYSPNSGVAHIGKKVSYQAKTSAIQKLSEVLPLDAAYWQAIPESDLQSCLQSFEQISEAYAMFILQPRATLPQQQNASLSLCLFAHKLALRLDKGNLKSFGIDIKPFISAGTDPSCILFRPEDFEKRQKLLAYFERLPYPQLFDYESHRKLTSGQRFPEDLLFFPYLENNPIFLTKLETLVKTTPKTPRDVLRAGLVLSDLKSFRNPENEHLYILQKTAFFARLFAGQALNEENTNPTHSIDFSLSPSDGEASIFHRYGGSWIGKIPKLRLLRSHRGSEKQPEFVRDILLTDQFQRDPEKLKSESEQLIVFKESFAVPHDVLASCTQCEPSLQPAKIIHYFSENLHLLESPDVQTLFDALFFKIIVQNQWERVPLFNELKNNQKLIEQCRDLIFQGLNCFYNRRPGKQPDVFSSLFFVRLASRLMAICPNSVGIPPVIPIMNEWLTRGGLTSEESAAIHLHRAYAHSLTPTEQLKNSPEKIQETMESWILTTNQEPHPHWKEIDLLSSVASFIYGQKELFEKFYKSNDAALNRILNIMDLDKREHRYWSYDFPCFWIHRGQDSWIMNLFTGEISSQNGLMKIGQYKDIGDDPHYVRLFGKNRFHCRIVGEWIYFIHPQYGQIRIQAPKQHFTSDMAIQRQINGSWWQYIRPQLLEKSEIPIVAIADHSHWMSLDKRNDFPSQVLLSYDLKNRDLVYEMNSEKGITESRGGKRILSETEKMENEFVDLFADLEAFERRDCLIVQGAQSYNNQPSPLNQISLPRYLSRNGETLRFFYEEGKLHWSENHPFCLVHSKEAPTFLANFQNGLLLRDKKKNLKVLIPIRDFRSSKSYDRNSKLDVHDENFKTTLEPQRGVYRYLEFDLKDNDLLPLSDEGRLFLSYLYLGQKRYEKAADILKKRPQTDSLSLEGEEILKKIILEMAYRGDRGPSSAALRLRAALVLARENLQPRDEPKKYSKVLLDHIFLAIEDYKRAEAKVPGALRLTPLDWILLKQAFNQTPSSLGSSKTQASFHWDDQLKRHDNAKDLGDEKNLNLHNLQTLFSEITWMPDRPAPNAGIKSSFGWYYRAALSAPTPKNREGLRHQIELMRAFDKENDKNWPEYRNRLYDYIRLALLEPDKVLPLPNPFTAVELRKWLLEMRGIYGSRIPFQNQRIQPLQQMEITPKEIPVTLSLKDAAKRLQKPQANSFLPNLFDFDPSPFNLSSLATAHLKEVNASLNNSAEAPRSVASEELGQEEQVFLESVRVEFEEFGKDFTAGAQINKQQTLYQFYSVSEEKELDKTLGRYINVQKERVEQWSTLITTLANRKPDGLGLTKALLEEGGYLQKLSIEDCVNAFCRRSYKRLTVINPSLERDDLSTLMRLTQGYLIDANDLNQAERAQELLKKAQEIRNEGAEPDEIASLIHQMGLELHAKPVYNPSVDLEMLVFEYRANLRMRPKQVELIKKICQADPQSKLFKDAVIQLIMGGGKTQIIASLVLIITADGENIPIFTAPAAQFESLKQNLGTTQKHNFDQTLRTIDLSRANLTLPNLQWLRRELEDAQALGDPLLFKNDKIAALQLEYLYLLDLTPTEEINKKIDELQKINVLIQSHAIALWDEIDLLMNPHHETNFPVGEAENLNPMHVDLMRKIFEIFLSNEITVPKMEGKSLKSLLRLEENCSFTLSPEDFCNMVAPIAALALAKNHEEDLYVPSHFHAQFVKYVTGKMVKENLSREDIAFLQFVKNMKAALQEEERDAADLICLAKHFFSDIFPSTLQKSVGRHFGRSRTGNPGKVVPYLGVDAPATTEFGDQWEAAAYQFMTASARGITIRQIELVASMLHRAVEHLLEKRDDISFDETPAARGFFELTGVPLSQIKTEGALEKARANIEKDPSKKLAVEAELTSEFVTFYPEYLSSNPQDFAAQFPKGKRTGLTGTPFNYSCYPKPLAENVIRDDGVDGRIVEQMLSRSKNSFALYSIKTSGVKDLLQGYKEIRGIPARGIIDASGIFRDYDNEKVAREILQNIDNPQIDTILYFGRKHPEDVLPDHLCALRQGIDKPLFIGSTRKVELQKHGITPDRCFTFYDERHCEATDIVQALDAVNIMTIDEKVSLRRLSQGALRLRGYFLRQDIVFAVLKDSQPQLIGKGATVEDIIRTAIKNQAIQIANDTFLSYKHRIRGAVRQSILQKLLEVTAKEAPAFFKQYREIFVSTRANSPFDQYFELETQTSSLEALEQIRNLWIELFKKKNSDPTLLQAVVNETNEVLQEAANNPFLASRVPKIQSNNEDQQIDIDLERVQAVIDMDLERVQGVVDLNLERELNLDLQRELQRYQTTAVKDKYEEHRWNLQMVEAQSFPELYQNYDLPSFSAFYSLSALMEKGHLAPPYLYPYHRLFDPDLLVSGNWAHTTNNFLSIFHKQHKPPYQILVQIKNDKLTIMLLSIQDAAFFKEYLSRTKKQDMWLILPDGHEISKHSHIVDDNHTIRLKDLLIQVNFLSGNARYLDHHEKETVRYFEKEDRDLKIRFLRLKVEKIKNQKAVFYQSEILNPEAAAKAGRSIYTRINDVEMRKYVKNLIRPDQVEMISHDLVRFITNGAMIPHLKTEPQIQKLREAQISYLSVEQVPMLLSHQVRYLPTHRPELINAVTKMQLEFLLPNQIKKLNEHNVKFLPKKKFEDLDLTQVPFVPVNRLKELPDPLIQGVSKIQVPYLDRSKLHLCVTSDQLNAIPPSQIPFPGMTNENFGLFNEETLKAVLKENIQQLDEDKVRLIKCPDAIKRLSETQVNQITPEQIPHLANDQIKFAKRPDLFRIIIAGNSIRWIDNDQIDLIEIEHVPSLEDRQLRFLKKRDLIQAVEIERLKNLDKEHYIHFSDSQVKATPIENVDWLEDDQLKLLEDPVRIKKIPVGRVEHIVSSQIPHLELNQIPGLPPHLVPYLADDGLKFLTTLNQIRKISVERIGNIVSSQISHLDETQIPGLSPDLISHLANERLKFLKTRDHIRRIPLEKVQYIVSSQVPDLDDTQIPGLSPDLISHLANERLKFLKTRDQIRKIPVEKVQYIVPSQILDLDASQIPGLSPDLVPILPNKRLKNLRTQDQIGKIPVGSVQHIILSQISHLDASQIPGLSPDLVPYLADEMLKFLKDPHQIKKIPVEKVQHIIPSQILHLDDTQIPSLSLNLISHLANERLKFLKTQDQIRKIPVEKIQYIVSSQVPDLDDTQIPGLSPNLVPNLANERLELLRDLHQIKKIPVEKIQYIVSSQVPDLDETQIPGLSPDLVPALTEASLKYLKTKDQIRAVNPSQIAHLDDEQLPFLKDEQIKVIDPQKVSKLHVSQYQYLDTVEQIQAVPEESIHNLTKGQILRRYNLSLATTIGYLALGILGYIGRLLSWFILLPLLANYIECANKLHLSLIRTSRKAAIAIRILF